MCDSRISQTSGMLFVPNHKMMCKHFKKISGVKENGFYLQKKKKRIWQFVTLERFHFIFHELCFLSVKQRNLHTPQCIHSLHIHRLIHRRTYAYVKQPMCKVEGFKGCLLVVLFILYEFRNREFLMYNKNMKAPLMLLMCSHVTMQEQLLNQLVTVAAWINNCIEPHGMHLLAC